MRKHNILRRIAGVAAAAAITPPPATLPTALRAQALPAPWERISALHSGLVATIPSPGTTNNLQAVQQPFSANEWSGHWWKLPVPNVRDAFQLVNRYSHQCLAVGGAVFTPGAPIVQNPCDAALPNQWWLFVNHPAEQAWQVMSGLSAMTMTVENGSTQMGARFVQQPFANGFPNQLMQMWG
jgi:hypothetical protein